MTELQSCSSVRLQRLTHILTDDAKSPNSLRPECRRKSCSVAPVSGCKYQIRDREEQRRDAFTQATRWIQISPPLITLVTRRAQTRSVHVTSCHGDNTMTSNFVLSLDGSNERAKKREWVRMLRRTSSPRYPHRHRPLHTPRPSSTKTKPQEQRNV